MVEEALKALSSADAPSARDHLFEIAVLARIERRRFYWAMARNAGIALAASAVLAAVVPGLERLWPMELPIGAYLPNGLTQLHVLPSTVNANLVLGMALTLACLILPWRRLMD